MSDNKLKIRIQIQQPHQAIEEIYPELVEPEIEYRQSWDRKRISIAILVLLFILALTGYILFNSTRNEPSTNEKTEAAINQSVTHENSISAEKVASEIIQPKDTQKSVKTADLPEQTTTSLIKSKPVQEIRKPTVIPRKKPKISHAKPLTTSASNHPKYSGRS
jgi:cytoskeletal protein RodZ